MFKERTTARNGYHHIQLHEHIFSWENIFHLFISASLFITFLSTTLLTQNVLISGKHKGTPMLKEGIKCVGADPDDDSEQSDWAGFT